MALSHTHTHAHRHTLNWICKIFWGRNSKGETPRKTSAKAESVSSCHSVRSLALWITPKSTVFYGQVCVAATLPQLFPLPPPDFLSWTHTNYQVAVNCILRLWSAQLLLVLVASQWNQSYINCTNNSAHSLCNGQAYSTPLTPFTQPPLPLAAPLAQLSCSQAEDKGAWNDNQSQKNHHFAADRNASQNRQR